MHALFAEAVDAIAYGDLDALTKLLDRAPELAQERTPAPERATLIHYTGFNAFEEVSHPAPANTPAIARLLLERGAEADALAFGDDRATAMCWALSSWFTAMSDVQIQLVDVYLDGGAAIEGVSDNGAPLGHAIGFGYRRAAEHLARRGARVDHLLAASALGDLDRIRSWRDVQGRYAAAAMNFAHGDKPETGRFSWPRESNPDPDTLALLTAATHGRDEIVSWLLEVGVDPRASLSFGQTALHFAAYIGYPKVVHLLLQAGAPADAVERQFHRTPAQWARETGEDELARQIEAACS